VPRRTTVEHPLIHDRGRGPELVGTRITVYDLIPYLEDPPFSDEEMLKLWPSVTAEGLAALKAYIADHRDEVMAKHWEIEARMIREWAAQCTPDNLAHWAETRRRMDAFRTWVRFRQLEGTLPPAGERLAAFRTWWEAVQHAAAGATP
jgi:uncharacterized protein (DUF433 family)